MSDERSPRRAGWRRLTADEELLWSTVARSIKPLRSDRKVGLAVVREPTTADDARSFKKMPVPRQPPVTPPPHPGSSRAPTFIPRREKQRLDSGKATIDGRIDLHGMTQAQAHDALLRFLHHAHAGGAKFLLVITGKGGLNGQAGILRRQVPLWLGLPEFRALVLGFDVAHVQHGGAGALYVRLRKRHSLRG